MNREQDLLSMLRPSGRRGKALRVPEEKERASYCEQDGSQRRQQDQLDSSGRFGGFIHAVVCDPRSFRNGEGVIALSGNQKRSQADSPVDSGRTHDRVQRLWMSDVTKVKAYTAVEVVA